MKRLNPSSERLVDFMAESRPDQRAALETRFGELAIERGYLNRVELEDSLRNQQKAGYSVPLGRILVERGYLTGTQVEELLKLQQRSLQICVPCGRYYNVAAHAPGVRLRCLGCGEVLRGPNDLPTELKSSSSPAAFAGRRAEVGTRLGKYMILRQVGQGGMSAVYEAEDLELGRRVALKVLHDDFGSRQLVLRLHREAAIAARLNHPNIVSIHEVAIVPTASGSAIHYIAMDFIAGQTLAERMAPRKSPRAELLRMLEDVAHAVEYAHEQGIIHRDLKPSNILVTAEGRAILGDFGLARAEAITEGLTESQAILGTPQYMAPEQVRGKRTEIGKHTDIYALGVILYEILVGHCPFHGPTTPAVYEKILHNEPPLPRRLRRSVEPDLELIALKALEKEPARRYLSAQAFAEDLRRFRAGEPIVARPPSLVYRLRKRARKHRLLVAAVGASLAVGASVELLVVAPIWRSRISPETEPAQVEAIVVRAHDLEKQGDALGALAEYGKAIAINPRHALAYADRSKLWTETGQSDKALADAEKAIALDPGLATAYSSRAAVRVLRDELDLGLRDVEEAIRLDPKSGWFTCQRGLVWLKKGELAAADRDFAEAVRLDPALANAYNSLGALREQQGDLDGALAFYEVFIRLHPRSVLGHYNRARVLHVRGDREAALAGYDEAVRLAPQVAEPYTNRGALYLQLGRFNEALSDCEQALRLKPADVDPRYNRAVVWEHMGQWKAAIADCDKVIQAKPTHADAYHVRGKCKANLEEWAEAVADIEMALELAPADWQGRSDAEERLKLARTRLRAHTEDRRKDR